MKMGRMLNTISLDMSVKKLTTPRAYIFLMPLFSSELDIHNIGKLGYIRISQHTTDKLLKTHD